MTQAAVAIIRKDKRFLVCQRKKNSRYGLKWEFPGGKVEEGESLVECVKRELREELSIEVVEISRSETQTNRFADGGIFEVTYFTIKRFNDTPVNNAFEEIRWVSLEELKSLDVLEGNKAIIAGLSDD